MKTRDVLADIGRALRDPDFRREYGAQTMKYDLAAALVEARQAKKLTQKGLAERIGVSQAYIAKLESGAANPTIGLVGSLLATLWLRSRFQLVPLAPRSVAEPATLAQFYWTTDLDVLSEVSLGSLNLPVAQWPAEASVSSRILPQAWVSTKPEALPMFRPLGPGLPPKSIELSTTATTMTPQEKTPDSAIDESVTAVAA